MRGHTGIRLQRRRRGEKDREEEGGRRQEKEQREAELWPWRLSNITTDLKWSVSRSNCRVAAAE